MRHGPAENCAALAIAAQSRGGGRKGGGGGGGGAGLVPGGGKPNLRKAGDGGVGSVQVAGTRKGVLQNGEREGQKGLIRSASHTLRREGKAFAM